MPITFTSDDMNWFLAALDRNPSMKMSLFTDKLQSIMASGDAQGLNFLLQLLETTPVTGTLGSLPKALIQLSDLHERLRAEIQARQGATPT